ncbi:PINc domain-containing protein [Favolaschia claudopus]|uniref:PINc domain-containing protein n=1 Tax=Favolaschia claudopus TaxID=2862362 RepID=A0AAW0AZB0_9AGAR
MTDKKAMSRALGAAFLNHQVEQLEKSAASGNWRSRGPPASPQSSPKRQPYSNNKSSLRGKKNGGGNTSTSTFVISTKDSAQRRSVEEPNAEKDADVVIVDASVLVHALHQVKRWCRDGREEVVIVPLEALNTLDLLKKGTSPLAQRARAASRILEAQVGTNLRIRVQRDDAFVPWDAIAFASPTQSTAGNSSPTSAVSPATDLPADDPEWVRRTVCCARWELNSTLASSSPSNSKFNGNDTPPPPRTVCIAVLASTPPPPPADSADVPNKHEVRASGTLVAHWAARAGLTVLPVAPSVHVNGNPGGAQSNTASATAFTQGGTGTTGEGTRRPGTTGEGTRRPGTSEGARRPRANTNPQQGQGKRGAGAGGYGGANSSSNNNGNNNGMYKLSGGGGSGGGGSLVERPAAALAMESSGAGPQRVIRVLARGERLDAAAGV